MEEQETGTPGRRTRSRAAKSTPAKVEKASPRKTRKKVVLMEVEVSEDEDETLEGKNADEDESGSESVKEAPVPSKRRKVNTDVKNGNSDTKDANENSDAELETKVKNDDPPVVVEPMAESKTPVQKSIDLNGDGNTETGLSETEEKTAKPNKSEPEKQKEVDTDTEKNEELEKKKQEAKELEKEEEAKEVEKKKEAVKNKEIEKKKKEEAKKIEKKKSGEVDKETKIPEVKTESVKAETTVEQSRHEDKNVKLSSSKQVETKTEESVEEKKEVKKEEEQVAERKEEKPVEIKNEVKSIIKNEEQCLAIKTEGIKMDFDEFKSELKEENNVGLEAMEKCVKKEEKSDQKDDTKTEEKKTVEAKPTVDPDAENISEDELPGVPVVKVPEAEEVSDEELPEPKRAELPADTEVVSEDELPSVKTDKKEGKKRKLDEAGYDPGSPTSENETPSKKAATESSGEKEKEKSPRPKKLPELDKYWKAVNDDPTDFTGWTYLLQYVDQENDMEAAREAYDAFLSHYPYCYGYWRKYADYEKRKGNKKKCEEVFERGLKAIPLSVDLWIHYLTYVKTTRTAEEDYIRSQFDRALTACGLEFRSDRLWDSYIKWETEGKRLQRVTAIYDKLLATPTQGYTTHFDSFQEHISSNPPNKVIEVDEFLALRKEVRHMLKHDITTEPGAADKEEASDAPPGDEEPSKMTSTDEETKAIRERIVSIRRKAHKATVSAVTSRWNYEEGIKRPYFHVKALERCQLKNWHDYLDYESEQGDRTRIIVLFERCLIACALYEDFWLKFVHYLESVKDPELQPKIRDVYERACTIHHLKKPNLHLQWAIFEEGVGNATRAAEILVNLEKSVPNILQIAYRRINLERRRGDFEKCTQLYEHYINNSKNKMVASNISIKYSRFCLKVMKDVNKAQEILKTAITKDLNNPRLYLQLVDMTLQKENVAQSEVTEIIDSFLDRDSTDPEQKVLFAQRKLEYLEDFGSDVQSVQLAYESYQKYSKLNKEHAKKKEIKSESATTASKNEKGTTQATTQASSYSGYSSYGNTAQPPYAYSGGQQGQYNYSQYGQGDQYQYQNWQYPQGGYGGYNQWGGYGGGYSY